MTCNLSNGARRVLVAATTSVLALAWSTASQAQTAPSRTLPETIAPPAVQAADGEIALPATRLSAAPAGAEALSVRVDRVVVEGVAPEQAAAIRALVAPVEGRTVTVAALYAAAARIEALYARDGAILTRAVLPPQSLKDGAVVRIVVVEGFIESIDDSGVPAKVRGPIRERLARLVNAPGLRLAQIERQVLLAARVPGVNLRTTLVPGERPGAARLVLQVEHDALSVGLGADNTLSGAYDDWSLEARLTANSLFGTGEQVYALGATATDLVFSGGHPYRRIAGAGLIAPLGADGLTAQVEYLHADTNPQTPRGALPVQGQFDRITARLSYPLVLTRRQMLSVSGGFEWIAERQTARGFDVKLSEDGLRVLTLGLEGGKAIGGEATVSSRIDLHQGLSALGARTPADARFSGTPLSRQGAKPDFTKLSASASFDRRLGGPFSARLVLRGQTGFGDALPSAMQFSLDNGEGVSGFDAGSINVDAGVTARLELGALVPAVGDVAARPYLFAAAGRGRLEKPTALEKARPDGWSAGAGVRAALTRRINFSAELAHANSNLFDKTNTRLTASVNVAF